MDSMNEMKDYFEDFSDDLLFSRDISINDSLNNTLTLKEKTVFQKETRFNKFLPYADLLDNEADALLAKIKGNLGRCLMLRDIQPGCVFWSNMLFQYVTLYNLRFTKEDHITFIKLMYELVTIPNLQSSIIFAIMAPLYRLLRVNNLISPEEMELPWRPLYNLYHFIISQDEQQICFYTHPDNLKDFIESIIHGAKAYFPVNATQEILDELRPRIGQFQSDEIRFVMKLFELFLPVQVAPKHHSLGYELWFHEFMKMWKHCNYNSCGWEHSITCLMSKLAWINIGYIDWEPYMPLMFTRFLKSLNLPVHYKKQRINYDTFCRIGPYSVSLWIVSILGNKSKAQIYLEKFLKTIETYFHPANHGSWLKRLGKLFVNISYLIVMRIHWERYDTKPTWKTPIPESHRLTDADIDAFVNSMMPIALLGIFNNYCSQNFYDALHYLAILRPNLVIPNVLDKIYPNLGSDIEPHKLITAMTCLIKISRPLVQGSRVPNKDYAYQEGPLQVLPLLFSSLSGIDPNDQTKCIVTFRLIATYVTMIPIADSSKSTADLSENERMICEETSRFEDFVLQFMDKVFAWIESCAVESVRLENQTNANRKSQSETIAEITLNQVFSVLLRQLSSPIFLSALNKLRAFIMDNFLETQVAGPLVAVLCHIFSNVNGHETLKALFPLLSEKLLNIIGDDDELVKVENLDNQLLYPLLLCSRLTAATGDVLLPYADTIVKILDKVIKFQSCEGNAMACYMLTSVCLSFSTVTFTNVERDLDNPDYPYVKDWGKTADVDIIKVKTYVPGEKELEFLQKLFKRYLIPAMESIENFVKNQNSLTREELYVTLKIIYFILSGCDSVLPVWKEPALVKKTYENCIENFEPICDYTKVLKMPDGNNVRHSLTQTMTALQETMLRNAEDDTKSLIMLSLIWQKLLVGNSGPPVKSRVVTNYYIPKKIIENKMTGCDGWFSFIVLTRIFSQHQMRKMCTVLVFTETHKSILINLLKLSTSRYSRIRIVAQEAFIKTLDFFPYAYEYLRPHIIEILQRDKTVHHHAYKSVLYLITAEMTNEPALLLKQDWEYIRSLWPALLLSEASEKPSVVHLEKLIVGMFEDFYTTNIKLEFSDVSVSAAQNLWNVGAKPSILPPTLKEIEQSIENLRKTGENNLRIYNDLLNIILEALLEKNLHWRHRQMAMNIILALKHPEQVYPPQIVRYFLDALIHESIKVRKLAILALMYIFKQIKKNYIKIKIQVPKVNGTSVLQPGCREDNAWLRYNSETRPNNSIEWNQPRYVHKCNIGYYAWPHELEVYAPASEQPRFDANNMSEQEREIVEFFSKQQNVDKFVEYLSLEGKKGEKVNIVRFAFFKGLFRNFDDAFLPNFLTHLRQFATNKQENVQRCAAEIICGLIRGTKHWPYDKTVAMWESLLPIIRSILNNLTKETIGKWSLCIAYACINRDPNKIHWLLECLMESSLVDQSDASVVEYGKLMIIENALVCQSWRVDELLQRLLQRFENRFGESPLQIVRDRLASMLAFIFGGNFTFEMSNGHRHPEARDFLDKVYPSLQSLVNEDETSESADSQAALDMIEFDKNNVFRSNPSKAKREQNIRLCNTICKWIKTTVSNWNLESLTNFYRIYPIICQLENKEKDVEVTMACTESMAILAQSLTLPEHIPTVLEAIGSVSVSTSWSSRASCLEFLQVFVFYNMSVLLSEELWITAIQSIVLRLLEDDRLEVREKAAQVLGGLLHCTIIPDQESLLEEFKKKARTKVNNKRKRLSSKEEELAKSAKKFNAVILRHAGVLGMCAFIQAHPYDIPKYIPPIFECLSLHLNDPEPIPSTIRKTLNNFKRTHCDGWTGLQGLADKFTEEQFAVIQDLSMPPSYYA